MSEAHSNLEHARVKGRNVEDAPEEVNYLPETYTTDDVITETDSTLTRDIHPSTMSPTQIAKALVTKSLGC